MTRVSGHVESTAPISLCFAWNTIENNALASFNQFVARRISYPLNLERLAAECGYIPAEQHALSFEGSPYENMSSVARKTAYVSPIINGVIIPFLATHNFSRDNCINAMNEVRRRSVDIPGFTYGNAQKWINMSIKYYLILLAYLPHLATNAHERFNGSCFNKSINNDNITELHPIRDFYNETKFYEYGLFPIDTPMCKHITADFGELPPPVYSPYPWSRNDTQREFEDYWELVLSRITDSASGWTDFIPLLYEIYVW